PLHLRDPGPGWATPRTFFLPDPAAAGTARPSSPLIPIEADPIIPSPPPEKLPHGGPPAPRDHPSPHAGERRRRRGARPAAPARLRRAPGARAPPAPPAGRHRDPQHDGARPRGLPQARGEAGGHVGEPPPLLPPRRPHHARHP